MMMKTKEKQVEHYFGTCAKMLFEQKIMTTAPTTDSIYRCSV